MIVNSEQKRYRLPAMICRDAQCAPAVTDTAIVGNAAPAFPAFCIPIHKKIPLTHNPGALRQILLQN